jgi:XTP/dITP diphosphohydrolase
MGRTETERRKVSVSPVYPCLPATVKAMRLQEKAKQVGFEWDDTGQVCRKCRKNYRNYRAVKEANRAKIEEEFGDVVFID